MPISKSKQNHLRAFLQEKFKNFKKLWNKVSELISKIQTEMDDVFVSGDGAIKTKQKIVAKKLNKYFINVVQNLWKDLGKSNSKFRDYLKNPNENSLFVKETESDEI